VGQGERRDTSGEVVHKKGKSGELFAATSENGIRGRLTHACLGQRDGSVVRSMLNMSGPRNSRTAKAP
jgi:hypothetical protein